MAGGGTLIKGNSSGSNRTRPYAMILLLAFGAAILSVMVLHKFRERRVFNLLVKDRDHQLLSLHLLLQKEKESTREIKKKSEEMKAKIYFLRNQKMELNRRFLEMQSAIAALKDEQRTMESALEEKDNEIKVLREQETDSSYENPQLVALTGILKQKEAEIEDLKRRATEYPVNVRSVSTDDPSNPPVNLTASASKEEGGQLINSTYSKYGDNSSRDGSEIINGENEIKEITEEDNLQKLDDGIVAGENNIDESKIEDSQSISNATKAIDEGEVTVGQELGKISKGANLRMRQRHGYLSRRNGRRWRIIAKNRGIDHNVDAEYIASRRSAKAKQGSRLFEKKVKSNGQTHLKIRNKSSQEDGKPKIPNAFKQDETADTDHHVDKEERNIYTQGNLGSEEVMANTSVNGKGNSITGNARNKSLNEEVGQSEDTNQQNLNGSNTNKVRNDADEYEELENSNIANFHELETDAANGHSNMEEDKEEYKEETDESEF